MGQGADVAGAVADHREGFLVDGREDQLALNAVRKDFAGLGIDDFRDEVIFVHVHALLGGALKGDAGAGELGEAVDIVSLDAQGLLDVPAHFLRPGFRAENAGLQRNVVGAVAHFLHGLSQVGRVARRAAEDGGLQVHDEHDLALGVSGAGGDGEAAHLVGAAVQARAAGEQAVTVGDLADVFIGAAGCRDGAGTALFPEVDVVERIESDDALAGGAGGGLDADTVLQRDRQQAVGISLPEISFGEEGELFQIIHRLDIVRGDALFFHLFPVVGDIVPHVTDLLHETLGLDGPDLFAACAFDRFLIILFHKITCDTFQFG